MHFMLVAITLASGDAAAAFAAPPVAFPDGHYFTLPASSGFASPVRPQKAKRSKLDDHGGDCRSRIRPLMCLVDQPASVEARQCVTGGESYAPPFEELYDHLPGVLQNIFCALDVIYVETDFQGTAYAGSVGTRTVLGVKKSVLDGSLDLQHWASWKEQLSFGGGSGSFDVRADLPVVETQSSGQANDFLYFLIAHEFGHILDFHYRLNRVKPGCPEPVDGQPDPECLMEEDSWGGIGWLTNQRPKPENDFISRSGLCFYWCGDKPLSPSMVPSVYESLFEHSDFISIYATTEPWDDFADSLAYFLVHESLHASYRINTRQGAVYDVMEKLESPLFAKKRAYIEKFLQEAEGRPLPPLPKPLQLN